MKSPKIGQFSLEAIFISIYLTPQEVFSSYKGVMRGRKTPRPLIYFILLVAIALIYFPSFGYAKGLSDNAEEYRVKGYEAQAKGDAESAIEFYQKAVNLDPKYAAPHNDLGILYETKGWLDRAEAEYQKAIVMDPDYKDAHTNLALLYERKGELEKAAFHWMKRYKLGSRNDPWTKEAISRLEKLGLIDKLGKKNIGPSENRKENPPRKIYVKKKITKRCAPKIEERLERKNVSEKKSSSEWARIGSKTKRDPVKELKKKEKIREAKETSEWARLGSRKDASVEEEQENQISSEELKEEPSGNENLEKEIEESLRLAEEKSKKEKDKNVKPEKKAVAEPEKPTNSTVSNRDLQRELEESIKLAEERLRNRRAKSINSDSVEKESAKEYATKTPLTSDANMYYNKARDYCNKGEYSRALDAIRSSKESSPSNESLLELEQEVKNKMKEEKILDYYNEGMLRYRQKDFTGAKKEFEAILDILPE